MKMMIDKENCIGCQACADMCPVQAVQLRYDIWGEGKAVVNLDTCIHCGLCDEICPGKVVVCNKEPEYIYAVVSKNHRQSGSSGGIFYELASHFLARGGVVFGASFDNGLQLKHVKAENISEILPLCKSKYLYSDMTGIYREIKQMLEFGKKVMYVGAPCQVSAIKNLFGEYYNNLFLVDFLCHGTGTQKIFNVCIAEEEKKKDGKIREFYFRSKSKRAAHSFTYILEKKNKKKYIYGYAFEFPYYYSFLKYILFKDACYSCKYAQRARIGDITLGDFWGIQKYNKKLHDQKGVSMVSVNSEAGYRIFSGIENQCKVYKYPWRFAGENNVAFSSKNDDPAGKRELLNILANEGEEALIKKLSCPNVYKHLIHANIPKFVIKIYHKFRGRK